MAKCIQIKARDIQMGVIRYGVIHKRKSVLPYFAVTDVRRTLMSTNFLAYSVLFTPNFGPAFRDSL